MAKQTVALYSVTSGDRLEHARTSLTEALGGASLGDVDDAGVFEVKVDAESPEQARSLVREAFARAGTGDDFVIRETTEGQEMASDDPRQGAEPASGIADRASSVAEAAASVAAAAGGAASSAASRAKEAAEESGAADQARQYAEQAQSTAAAAARENPWLKYGAPIGGLLLLLALLRRRSG